MADAISSEEVKKIASLARLELSEDEVAQYAEQLSAILDYVGQLGEVDTENAAVTSQVTGLSNVMREDKVDACDEPGELVGLAPEHEKGFVKVKAVFE
ncbi:MAG: Asp-tRNA(Asn)/Glu-tRNA(Gln) amidotransferase subunit GatC [Patescibacteria group bacterium]